MRLSICFLLFAFILSVLARPTYDTTKDTKFLRTSEGRTLLEISEDTVQPKTQFGFDRTSHDKEETQPEGDGQNNRASQYETSGEASEASGHTQAVDQKPSRGQESGFVTDDGNKPFNPEPYVAALLGSGITAVTMKMPEIQRYLKESMRKRPAPIRTKAPPQELVQEPFGDKLELINEEPLWYQQGKRYTELQSKGRRVEAEALLDKIKFDPDGEKWVTRCIQKEVFITTEEQQYPFFDIQLTKLRQNG